MNVVDGPRAAWCAFLDISVQTQTAVPLAAFGLPYPGYEINGPENGQQARSATGVALLENNELTLSGTLSGRFACSRRSFSAAWRATTTAILLPAHGARPSM